MPNHNQPSEKYSIYQTSRKKKLHNEALLGLLSGSRSLLTKALASILLSSFKSDQTEETPQPPLVTEHYFAPRPERSWSTLFWSVVAPILFPPLLVWDLVKFTFNWLLGGLVSRIILPAQDMNFHVHYRNHLNKAANEINLEGRLEAKRIRVHTYDGAELDTLQLCSTARLPIQEQKFLINLTGNAMCCEQTFDEMRDDALALNCNVIGFNHRGVGRSSSRPTSKDQLIIDGIAQVQRLLDQGVDPENITLKGFSLGGAIGTLVAKHFLDHGHKINIFNDRSFSTITNFCVGHIRKADWLAPNGHRESFFKKLLGWILKPFIMLVLALTNWEIDAASAWKSIPATHKEHMVVRSSKADREQAGHVIVDDAVIPHYASLHAATKLERSALKQTIEASLKALNQRDSTTLAGSSLTEAKKHLLEAKAVIKERKMVGTGYHNYNAHSEHPDHLRGRHHGGSGKEFFRGFFKRTQEHHRHEREKVVLGQNVFARSAATSSF